MGALEDAQKQIEEAMKMAQQAGGGAWAGQAMGEAAAQVAANDAAIGEVPPGDPRLEPIDGISFERYAELCKAMQPAGTDTSQYEAIAVANGVPPGTWDGIMERWNARILGDRQMTLALNKLITGRA
jgi:hypothetical protein